MGDFKPDFKEWESFVNAILNLKHEVKIALVGKYAGLADSYVSMSEALRHGGAMCKTKISIDYVVYFEFADFFFRYWCFKMVNSHFSFTLPFYGLNILPFRRR